MERLNQAALRRVSEFLRENYALRGPASFIKQTLSGLRRVVPAEFVASSEMLPAKKISVNTFEPAEHPAPKEGEPRWPGVMHEHPVLRHYLQTSDRRAFKISDFFTEREFRGRALYADFYRVMRVRDVMCFEIPSSAPVILGVALHRSRRSFTEGERLMLNLVRPHLTQAWRNAREYTRLTEDVRALGEALDLLDRGVIVLNSAGRAQFTTKRATQLLADYFHDGRRQTNHLPEELQRWVSAIEARLHADAVPPPRLPLVVERERRHLSIRLVSDGAKRVLLLEEHADNLQPERLRSLGLSRREAEVLACVARGRTNATVASILNVSVLTIKKHLQHIFDKLGVETRTAATVRALTASRGLVHNIGLAPPTGE